ncbi:transcriptional regulator [Bacteroides sp. CAG:754]|uniref:AraC family transcriptional regulator n=1 Tax=Bacteroides congonensis TaxID=1871006 RepID=UPI000334B6F3|nr:helix-turn-helix domain-containing protein [Bacteroides congonensis]CDA84402.1 transcriptional regulator [Bacteroides sp. CAG:754]
MEQKGPMELGLRTLENLKVVRNNEFRFISSEFGFVNSFRKMEATLFSIGQPYRIQEGRIIFVNQGSARVLINLIEYTIRQTHFSVITPNSIIQIIEISPDFDMQMMAMNQDFLPISGKEDFFSYLLHHQKNILLLLSPQEVLQTEYYFTLMWNILQEPTFRREAIRHLLASLLYYIEYIAQSNMLMNPVRLTRQEDIFQRFISLVNACSKKERNVNFYADKLCLTPRYLNTVVRQASQQTVMDWINQSIILEAKILLKHGNRLVYQISDELNFPNPSFFCKFFKRMTGMTPHEYQNSK